MSAPYHTLKPGTSLQCKFMDWQESLEMVQPSPLLKAGAATAVQDCVQLSFEYLQGLRFKLGCFFMFNHKYLLFPPWLHVIISMDQQLR